jgi:hypothetical protein
MRRAGSAVALGLLEIPTIALTCGQPKMGNSVVAPTSP